MKAGKIYIIAVRLLITAFVLFGTGLAQNTKSEKFDIGKMWTFEHAPVDYFSETYGFKPTQEWLDDVRLSALRFGNGCSSSFISEDGLVMTNHHCGRGYVTSITLPGEDLSVTGFFAEKLSDERPVPGLFVDQLIKTVDVTNEILSAMESGKTDAEKSELKSSRIKEIENKYSSETGLQCRVITFYNGGMYMLYCYKRYTDVRLVFSPENLVAHFGGDPDNFTYPRYDFDCAFFRVYENNAPMKSTNYFNWSKNGAVPGEPLFVIGNPGSTERLKTYAQLEFARDYTVPSRLEELDFMADYVDKYLKENPEYKPRYQNTLFGVQNSQKVYRGQIKALNDPVMMSRKKDFEDNIKAKVNSSPNLSEKYGNLWKEIEDASIEWGRIFNALKGYDINTRFRSRYVLAARTIFRNAAEGRNTPDSVINAIYNRFDPDYNNGLLEYECRLMKKLLGENDKALTKVFADKSSDEMKDYILANSLVINKDGAQKLAEMNKDELFKTSDPLIQFFLESKQEYDKLLVKQKEVIAAIDVNSQLLGQLLYEIYGTSIPPDATLTLRISDGVIKSYEYNGTIAPEFTTFYGLYDRYYSHGKEYPWDLPERWINRPMEFNLETPYNLISTNDIIGGNSGSAIINTKAEVVGLVFDGNIESLPGRYIYTTEANRTVAVDSRGLLEAIKDLYKARRLAEEIETGRMVK